MSKLIMWFTTNKKNGIKCNGGELSHLHSQEEIKQSERINLIFIVFAQLITKYDASLYQPAT